MTGKERTTRGRIHALCLSERKGVQKTPQRQVQVIVGHGFDGDAHAGPWHRQVSLLSLASVEFMRQRGADVDKGSFGENIIVDGLVLHALPVGTYLRSGTVLLRVTQIGKECHTMCAIGQAVGECIMPQQGIFCEVVEGGCLEEGAEIYIVPPPTSDEAQHDQ